MTLPKCPRCENHGTPCTVSEYIRRRAGCTLPTRIARMNGTTTVCEFCGWKLHEARQ